MIKVASNFGEFLKRSEAGSKKANETRRERKKQPKKMECETERQTNSDGLANCRCQCSECSSSSLSVWRTSGQSSSALVVWNSDSAPGSLMDEVGRHGNELPWSQFLLHLNQLYNLLLIFTVWLNSLSLCLTDPIKSWSSLRNSESEIQALNMLPRR